MLNRTVNWLKRNRADVLIAIVLLLIAGLPRLVDLGTFLTADEKNWIGRSYEFIRAFKDFRFNDMLQTTHPGVTTMWLTGAAVTAKMLVAHVPFSFRNLVHFVAAAQFPIALANTLAVPAVYLLLRRLVAHSANGFFIPLVASLFIALDPFLIGYSRVAHVDALLTSFMVLAALATIIYAQSGFSRRWLVASAVISAFAILTKAPAVFLLPFLGLVVLVYQPSVFRSWAGLKQRVRDSILWLLIIALLVVILWPAILWVPNPEGNVLVLTRDLSIAAATPHHMVEDYTLNPWHYPAALLTRTTPVTLVFASVFLVWLFCRSARALSKADEESRIRNQEASSQYNVQRTAYNVRLYWLLVAYVFFFTLMMTLVAKKGDRYMLPVFPMLDVFAAFGILVIGSFMRNWKLEIRNWKLRLQHILGLAMVVYLAATAWNDHPYAIAYSNPLFPDNLSQELGWGEGLEQVGAWLSQHDPHAVVASWYPEELGAYTSAHVAHINAHEQSKVRYVVLYRNMFGRAPDHYANNFIDEYYTKRAPVFVAQIAGKEFAWVYEKWAFEQVVGELVEGVRVGQEVEVGREELVGVDVFVATYLGKATAGELVVELTDLRSGVLVYRWHVPVQDIADDMWHSFKLPQPLSLPGRTLLVEISAVGTTPGNAPTIRYTSTGNFRPTQMVLNGEQKEADLAVRLRYFVGEDPTSAEASVGRQEATEEDTLLLLPSSRE